MRVFPHLLLPPSLPPASRRIARAHSSSPPPPPPLAAFNGSDAKSTVRRPQSQRTFIKDVGRQTQVLKLQGYLFFGTIATVEDEIRRLLDLAAWQHNPLRFLVCDFWLVNGLDFSAAEAFVRVQRLLAAKGVTLVFCGASPDGLVGRALQAVDLWSYGDESDVEVFDNLNEALEWTENAYLYVPCLSSLLLSDRL